MMNIEEKYLTEDIYSKKEHDILIDFADDLSKYSDDMKKVISFSPKTLNIKDIDRRKEILYNMYRKAKTRNFKKVVDTFIEYFSNIAEGYYENVDTSREGT